jgi:hypothetical protein
VYSLSRNRSKRVSQEPEEGEEMGETNEDNEEGQGSNEDQYVKKTWNPFPGLNISSTKPTT